MIGKLATLGVATACIAGIPGCATDSTPGYDYEVEGKVHRVSQFPASWGSKGGSRFNVGDDIRVYTCKIDKLSECAIIREGDQIKLKIASSTGEEEVVAIESIK